MATILIIILMAIIALLLLRIRVRYVNQPGEHTLFAGLGRSGMLNDYTNQEQRFMLFGWTISRGSLEEDDEAREIKLLKKAQKKARKAEKAKAKAEKARAKAEKAKTEAPEKEKPERKRRLSDVIEVIVKSQRAVRQFIMGMLRSLVVEELEGEVHAGLPEPDQTGMAYGYYQAALGAMPGVVGRVNFIPDWTGMSFNASGRAAVALPVYRLVGRTLKLAWSLPKMKIIRVAIGKKQSGVPNVEQRS